MLATSWSLSIVSLGRPLNTAVIVGVICPGSVWEITVALISSVTGVPSYNVYARVTVMTFGSGKFGAGSGSVGESTANARMVGDK